MRICVIAEGCYPYHVGGVSSWIHSMIETFPEYEFIVLAVLPDRSFRGKFKYLLPDNITEVHELYINDDDWSEAYNSKRKTKKLGKKEFAALKNLIMGVDTDWDLLFDLFGRKSTSIDNILMGPDFFQAVQDYYELKYPYMVFSDFLWTMRSIYMPLFFVFKMKIPEADVYHCLSNGYSGVLAGMAKHFHGGKIILSEHGIYIREREEELIKAKWLKNVHKNIWIEQFRKISRFGYERADMVTCLYEHARDLQVQFGCPRLKIAIAPNGIDTSRFDDLPGKTPDDEKFINIGAIARITPIKDIKTLIQAFINAKKREPQLKLWIMGPSDEEPEYAKECFDMVADNNVEDIVFTGNINVHDYLGRMDMTILTSISEGQPFTILESFAAHCPVIATNVGNCYGLIYGETDELGKAGIITHIMNIDEIAQAMIDLAESPDTRLEMGEVGYKRLMRRYKLEDMHEKYGSIYGYFDKVISAESEEIQSLEEFVAELNIVNNNAEISESGEAVSEEEAAENMEKELNIAATQYMIGSDIGASYDLGEKSASGSKSASYDEDDMDIAATQLLL